jgi:hypothetical protein
VASSNLSVEESLAACAVQCLEGMKNHLIASESSGAWMYGHAEEWRPALSRLVQWVKRGRTFRPPGRAFAAALKAS